MTRIHEEAKQFLERSRQRMKEWADRHRAENPKYTKGQLVMLNAQNITTKRPAKKLDQKMLGPFQIDEVISPTAVRLILPTRWRIHNSFHVSLIEPYRAGSQGNPDPLQVLREAGPIESEEYAIDEVMDSAKARGGSVKYLVKWEGWPNKKDWTWEPFEHFDSEGSRELLKAFHEQHPGKPVDVRLQQEQGE